MKKIFGLLFILYAALASATVSVSVNVKSVATTVPTQAITVRFLLQNCNGNVPRIVGTGVIVQQSYDFKPSAAGLVTGTIYGNDEIDCGGYQTSTYSVLYLKNGVPIQPSYNYLINAASGAFDLSTAAPISGIPAVYPPDGDTVYARLDGGNATGGTVAYRHQSNDFSAVNGIRFADQYPSLDAVFSGCATCTVVAPSSMASSTPSSSFASGTLWDLRGNTTPSNSVLGNTFSFNVNTGGGTKSFGRFDTVFNSIPAGGSVVSLYSLANARNLVVGSGIAVIGGASEANLFGTLTGNLPYAHAREDATTIATTGGTIAGASGVLGYVDITGTTPVTDVRGGWFRGCNTISGTAPTNCYGVVGDDQGSKASGYNFAGYFNGRTRIGYGSLNVAGIYFDNHLGVPPAIANIYTDSTDTLQIAARNSTGVLVQNNSGTNLMQVSDNGIVTFAQSNVLTATAAGTTHRFIELANTGNTGFYYGIESSVGGGVFTGSNAYESVLYSPVNNLYVKTPVARFSNTVQAAGFVGTGAPKIASGSASNTDVNGILTLAAGTVTYTFVNTYSSAPICFSKDVTTPANATVEVVTTTTLTITGTGTDDVKYICLGRN
jgi:hypothetical protein